MEAIPTKEGRAFVHLGYTYKQGSLTATGMRLNFATFERDKVGFTELGRSTAGEPQIIGGVRGLVERNTMRYFLALEASLSADSPTKRARRWYELTEQYPRQLHEASLNEYLASRPSSSRRSSMCKIPSQRALNRPRGFTPFLF